MGTVHVWDLDIEVGPPIAAPTAPATPVETKPSEKPAEKPGPKPTSTRGLRTWSSADGKFRVEAELVKMVAGIVHLKRKDGQVIQVPIDKLSEEDRKLLRKR